MVRAKFYVYSVNKTVNGAQITLNAVCRGEDTHRCWVREGDPPLVTAGKAGHTCTAGAGSILSGDYHGFLQNGVLT